MKLTFKKHKAETGLRAIANPRPNTTIKADNAFVGQINAPSRFGLEQDKWYISLRVTSEDHPGFRNVILKARFDSEAEARDFVKAKWHMLQETYTLLPDPTYEPWKN